MLLLEIDRIILNIFIFTNGHLNKKHGYIDGPYMIKNLLYHFFIINLFL
jgi:hypothetical protein